MTRLRNNFYNFTIRVKFVSDQNPNDFRTFEHGIPKLEKNSNDLEITFSRVKLSRTFEDNERIDLVSLGRRMVHPSGRAKTRRSADPRSTPVQFGYRSRLSKILSTSRVSEAGSRGGAEIKEAATFLYFSTDFLSSTDAKGDSFQGSFTCRQTMRKYNEKDFLFLSIGLSA